MKQILTLLIRGFQSSSIKTPEFKSFATKFRNALKKELLTVNAELISFSVGHFYVSGFFKLETGRIVYFSTSDVRDFRETNPMSRMLYREAKHPKDYTGGRNRYINYHDGMLKAIRDQFTMSETQTSFLMID